MIDANYAALGVTTRIIHEASSMSSNPRRHASIPLHRDPHTVYDLNDSRVSDSLTLRAWVAITEMRARNENNGKVTAELGYLGNCVLGIFETIGRSVAWGAVANPASAAIARCVSEGDPAKQRAYKELTVRLRDGTTATVEALLQSGKSLVSNPVSHEVNIIGARLTRGTLVKASFPDVPFRAYQRSDSF